MPPAPPTSRSRISADLLQRLPSGSAREPLALGRHGGEAARQIGAVIAVADRLVERVELGGVALDRLVHGIDQAGKRLVVHASSIRPAPSRCCEN